jgi:hypothetical protein
MLVAVDGMLLRVELDGSLELVDEVADVLGDVVDAAVDELDDDELLVVVDAVEVDVVELLELGGSSVLDVEADGTITVDGPEGPWITPAAAAVTPPTMSAAPTPMAASLRV